MKSHRWFVLTAIMVSMGVAGCGGGAAPTAAPVALPTTPPEAAPTTPPEEAAYQVVEVADGGTIKGVVTLAGQAPELEMLEVTKNADVFGQTIASEKFVVSAEGGLANVVVSILEISAGKAPSEEPVSLVNEGGRFLPHVQAAVAGSRVEIVSTDPVLHNTHTYLESRTVFNIALPNPDQVITKKFPKAGLVDVVCDAGHDWMSAFVMVLEHPYFAVTDEDGSFDISDVPPGDYVLQYWHEELGTLTADVTVPPGGEVEANFEFTQG